MNRNKKYYDMLYKKNIGYRYKTNTRYQWYLSKLLLGNIDKKDIVSVIDVGCGQGLNTMQLASYFTKAKILGIDLSEVGIKKAQEEFKCVQNLSFKCNNADHDAVWDDTYDLVCAFEVLEHLPMWESLLEKMTNSAQKFILLSAPIGKMRSYEIKHGHYRNFQKGELEAFLKKHNFSVVKVYYAGFPFWSPIMRNLLDLFPEKLEQMGEKQLTLFQKSIALTLYFLFRFLSSKKIGDQFIGLFKRE